MKYWATTTIELVDAWTCAYNQANVISIEAEMYKKNSRS
jgi:hemoglobin-like flavoprotein